MSGSDAATRAQELRDGAASLLREASLCPDPARRDAMTRMALAQIDEARLLMGHAEDVLALRPKRLH